MKSSYNDALVRLLKDEGGYTNNPSDPGGPTNFGITLADYRRYINSAGTAMDVRNMTVDQAKAIYKPKYWDKMGCDDLPAGVDYAVFDYGVNSGVTRAMNVNKKFKDITDPSKRINAICDERMAFLRNLKTFNVFGTGWTRRVTGVRAQSLKMATAKPGDSKGTAGGVIVGGALGGCVAATQTGHPWLWAAGVACAALVIGFGVLYYYYRKNQTHG